MRRIQLLVAWAGCLTAGVASPSAVGDRGELARLLDRRAEAFVAARNAAGDEPLVAFARDHLERA